MSLLLDSNALCSWLGGDRFDRSVRRRIERSAVSVSAVTAWELGHEQAIGKLRLPVSVAEAIEMHDFTPLPITVEHAERSARLPLHHRNPFDRVLIAQAQLERLTIVTRDPAFERYDVDVLRC